MVHKTASDTGLDTLCCFLLPFGHKKPTGTNAGERLELIVWSTSATWRAEWVDNLSPLTMYSAVMSRGVMFDETGDTRGQARHHDLPV